VTLFRSNRGRGPVAVENTAAAERDVTIEQARIALAVSVIDEALGGERSGPRLFNALLEVRHALAPSPRPLETSTSANQGATTA